MSIVSQEAAYWLFRLTDDAGAMSLEDRLEFARWIKQSPENVRELLLAHSMDGKLSRQKLCDRKTKVDSTVVHADFGKGLFQYDYQPCDSVSDEVPRKRKPAAKLRTWFARAAVFVMAVLLTLMLVNRAQEGVVETAASHLQQMNIEDGSSIQMDARTRLKVDLKAAERIIHLYSGQAVFEVASNRKRPFIVRTELVDVTAVGTKFGVRVDDSGVTATVLEGVVEVTSRDPRDGDIVRLYPGEKLHMPKSRAPQLLSERTKERVDAQREFEWTTGWITLRDAEVGEIVREFNRRHKVQVRIGDPDIAARTIDYGRLKVTSIESFEAVMKSQPGIQVSNEGSVITLTQPGRSE